MNWHDAATFFAMGGHGPFVWGAYGVTALVMVAEPLMAARRRRRAMQRAQEVDVDRREADGRRGSTLHELLPGTVLR